MPFIKKLINLVIWHVSCDLSPFAAHNDLLQFFINAPNDPDGLIWITIDYSLSCFCQDILIVLVYLAGLEDRWVLWYLQVFPLFAHFGLWCIWCVFAEFVIVFIIMAFATKISPIFYFFPLKWFDLSDMAGLKLLWRPVCLVVVLAKFVWKNQIDR